MRLQVFCLFVIITASGLLGQNINFQENFKDDSLEKWIVVDDKPTFSGPSNWFLENEVLRQTSNIWAYQAPLEFHYHLGTHVFIGDSNWTDYTFNAIVKTGDGIGLLFRYKNEKNYYRFLIIKDDNNGGPKWKIQKFIDGEVFTIYEEIVKDAIPKNWFALTADVRHDTISIYVNSKLFHSVLDSTYLKGKIGLTCYAMSDAHFDSISVNSKFNIYNEPKNLQTYVDRKPYIQLTDSNSVAIAWNSKIQSIGTVEYSLDNENPIRISEDSLTNNHLILLQNLISDTKYNYKVFNDLDVFADSNYFKTAEKQEDDSVSFLIWGDSGTGNEAQFSIAKRINLEADSVDFGVHVGDVSQSIGQEYDNIFFNPYAEFVSKKNVYTCIGNHDTYFDNAETYLKDFYYSLDTNITERYYTVKRGNIFLLIIDSNIDFSPQSKQYQFIQNVFLSDEYNNSTWKFVAFHHPAYCELWPEWGGDENVRDYLLPLFEQNEIDIVFNGHTHGYERGILNNVYYVITGGGGGGLDTYARDWTHIKKSISIHHYCKVSIIGNQLILKAIDNNGNVIDKLQIYKTLASERSNSTVSKFQLKLNQNYPNPFNNSTNISFTLDSITNVKIKLFNAIGEEVDAIDLGVKNAGSHSIPYSNNKLCTGIYMLSLITEKDLISKKIILLK